MTIEALYQEFLQSSGICTDTRKVVQDAVFVALKGENFDGSQFVETALREGCRLAITENSALSGDSRVRVVPSALGALQQLAHHHRMQLAPRVLAITGSNGKTTTKELIHTVLSSTFRVLSTRGNLNNHIGVPLTLLSLKGEEVAVVEMGANHPGEIASLCEIAAPEVGLITNVGKAHLEGFGSLDGVLNAKGELYEYLADHGGSAIIDGADSLLVQKARQTGVASLVAGPEGDIPLTCRLISQSPYLEVKVQAAGREISVSTRLVGAYNVQNIMLAVATGLHFGVPLSQIGDAVTNYTPHNRRSQFMEGERNRLILDSYNANPTSMREAVGGMLDYAKPPIMLILGEMAELGRISEDEHRELMHWITSLMADQNGREEQYSRSVQSRWADDKSQADQNDQGEKFSGSVQPRWADDKSQADQNDQGEKFSGSVQPRWADDKSQADQNGQAAQRPKVDRVLLVGERFFDLYQRQGAGHSWPDGMVAFRERGELENHLRSERPEGYHILVKGSRVNELENIVPLL